MIVIKNKNILMSESPSVSISITSKVCLLIVFTVVLFSATHSFSQGLSGHVNLIHNFREGLEDGEKTSDTSKTAQNLTLDFSKPITNALSYQFYLRESISDEETTDTRENMLTTKKRSLEPSMDIYLRNPMYNWSSGYRRQEEWSTARLTNEGRETSVFYYSRFNLMPKALPSLSLDFDRKEEFNYLDPMTLDKSNDDYSASSTYSLPSENVKFRYYMNYNHNVAKDEIGITEKTIDDSFNTNYSTGYSGFIWNRAVSYTVGYRGNYSRNKRRQFVTQTGSFLNERTQLGGFYIQNINDQVALNSLGSLIDNDVITSAGINLNTGTDHQIGIAVSSSRTVDRLYIYVDRDVSADTNLNAGSNWSILRSNFNQLNTWSSVSISSVVKIITDAANNTFRYEIEFTSPQNASFFKAVNTAASSILSVQATEIEAYGTDPLTTDELKSVDTSFTQGINLHAGIKPSENITIALTYSLDRTDQNPLSLSRSVGGVFQNLFDNTISGEKSNFRSQITRNYGITTIWQTHELLTTTSSYQKNENFDNMDQNDFTSNTYRIAFNYYPIPTLDSTLSVIRNESFSFGEKSNSNDSVLLSAGAELYKDLHLTTDIVYTKARSLPEDSAVTSNLVNVSLDARITKKISSTLTYNYNRQLTESAAPDFQESLLILNYRPGRFINLTGTVRYSDADGDVTISEGIAADWLPLPALRLNFNYDHTDSEPDPARNDSFNGLLIWYLTKFADLRFTFTYTQVVEATKTESYNYNTSLNARF
jgi:hypothetical protein